MNSVEIFSIVASITSILNFVLLLTNSYQITRVEKNTNSLTDRLVSEVRDASLAKGRLERTNKHGTSRR